MSNNPYAPPASPVSYAQPQRYFVSGLLYAFAGWLVYAFSRLIPVLFGGSCALPSYGLVGVLMLGFMPPALIGLGFMFWAERKNQPTKRLVGFVVGNVFFPLVVLLPLELALRQFFSQVNL